MAGGAARVYEASVPVFRHFAEDYILDVDGDGTLFTWRLLSSRRAHSPCLPRC
ncbi:MAG: hypothetical protein JWR37_2001 [Mycobacterium sp.]|jgi:hypothetical protein|nr:hypothetical protein [Mycobacterium sp.]